MVVFQFHLPFEFTREEDLHIAFCPVLDICSQGKTELEAKESLSVTIRLFIESCYERGTLTQVLIDSGFYASQESNDVEPDNKQYLDIPISLIANGAEVRAN